MLAFLGKFGPAKITSRDGCFVLKNKVSSPVMVIDFMRLGLNKSGATVT